MPHGGNDCIDARVYSSKIKTTKYLLWVWMYLYAAENPYTMMCHKGYDAVALVLGCIDTLIPVLGD